MNILQFYTKGLLLGCFLTCTFASLAEQPNLQAYADNMSLSGSVPKDEIVLDSNDEPTTLLVLNSNLEGLLFSGGRVIGDVKTSMFIEEKGDTIYSYLFNVLANTKNITVEHPNYLNVKLAFPVPLAGGMKYENIFIRGVLPQKAEIAEVSESNNTLPVRINRESFTTLYVDRAKIEGQSVLNLEKGSHEIVTEAYGEKYERNINVKDGMKPIDAHLGGVINLKYANGVKINPINGSEPVKKVESKNEYVDVIGDYEITASSSLIKDSSPLNIFYVRKNIKIKPRSTVTLHIDEMVPFLYIAYHGNHLQPLGASIGYRHTHFGWYASWSTDLVVKINTPYGEGSFDTTEHDSETGEENIVKNVKSTSYALTTGPILKIYRKLNIQVGGGVMRYLQTSQEGVLTQDFNYAWGAAAEASLLLKCRAFIIGAGVTHQFVKSAYKPQIANQINFTIGISL